MSESRKQEPSYKRHALLALSHALPAADHQRFTSLYEIVKQILTKVCLLMLHYDLVFLTELPYMVLIGTCKLYVLIGTCNLQDTGLELIAILWELLSKYVS